MKICYITDYPIPSFRAHSFQIMKMCQAMIQNGHDITLITPYKDQNLPDVYSASFWRQYGIQQKFFIQPLPYLYTGRFSDYLFGWKTVWNALRLKADLIYTRFPGAAIFSAFIGTPTICEFHEVPQYKQSVDKRFANIYGPLLKRAPWLLHYVVVTKALKMDLLKRYPNIFKDKKIVVAPDGVDLERFQHLPDRITARNLLNIDFPTNFVAGYAGHFYPGKGVEIIYQLASSNPQVTFLLIGGSREEVTSHRQRIRQKGLKNIILSGFVNNAELPTYLSACDALLLPNQLTPANHEYAYISRWTSPLKLFEYMACRRSIIASDLPVLREVLNDDNALLCPPDDLESWNRALRQCIHDVGLVEALVTQSRQDVDQYTWQNRVTHCLDGFK